MRFRQAPRTVGNRLVAGAFLPDETSPVTNKTPAHLKLHVENHKSGSAPQPAQARPSQLENLARVFEQATGWQLQYLEGDALGLSGEAWSAPVEGGGDSRGRLLLRPPAKQLDLESELAALASPPISIEQIRPLALAIAGMMSETNRLRHALWQREAELAAGVPVATRPDERQHLAQRLETVLKGGAEAVGCQAAGLYLLDETTTTLKLRAAWGLPTDRLLDAARPLRGAVADLEALVGHAVVLEDSSQLPHWRCPEEFSSGICVPVSSPTMPLGTLWIFSQTERTFSPEQTNLVEIIAGRIAADLEREMLLTVGADAKQRDKQIDSASRWQIDRLPSIAPLLEQWEVAGWTQQAESVGGDFFDWSVAPDGRLAVSVGDSQGTMVEAGLNAAALQAALKSHACYRHTASQMLERLNETLWTTSCGDQFAALFYGLVQPDSGELEFSLCGNVAAILVRQRESSAGKRRRSILTTPAPLLGSGPENKYQLANQTLRSGDLLVILSEGARNAVDEAGLRIGEAAMATLLAKHSRDTAAGLLSRLRRLLDRGGSAGEDQTVLIVKRR